MPDYVFSAHAQHMLARRRVSEEWVWRAIGDPDDKRRGDDDNLHFTKAIHEMDNRVLRVVVNTHVRPHRIVTLFFDRRLRRAR